MAVAANALCSLAEVREYLQRDSEEMESDDVLESLIDAASEAILQWTGREFAPKTDAATTRSFLYDGSGVLFLNPYDLRSVTSIVMDSGETSPTTLTADGYRLRPVQPRYGVYTHVRFSTTGECAASGEREVAVTGQWGFASVPANVKLAAKMQTAFLYRADVAAFSRTFDPVAQSISGGDGLAPSVMRLLIAFKHTRTA